MSVAACWAADSDVTELMLDHGADIAAEGPGGWTPLTCALQVPPARQPIHRETTLAQYNLRMHVGMLGTKWNRADQQ